jgi:hypothetical protein
MTASDTKNENNTVIRRKEQKERTHLLIVGMPRSGTSLLSSLLGAHSKIGIINEDYGRSWMDIIGKPVVGNKLCVPRQIGWRKKRGMGIKILNRLGLLSLWPKSEYSLKDYLKLPGLKIISIHRDSQDVRSSIMKRGGITKPTLKGEVKKGEISKKEVDYTIKKGGKLLRKLEKKEITWRVEFNELLSDPDSVIRDICQFLNIEYESSLVEQGTRWNWMYPESKEGIDKSKM